MGKTKPPQQRTGLVTVVFVRLLLLLQAEGTSLAFVGTHPQQRLLTLLFPSGRSWAASAAAARVAIICGATGGGGGNSPAPSNKSNNDNNNQSKNSLATFVSNVLMASSSAARRVAVANPDLDATLDDMVPSWDAVRSLWENQSQTPAERLFRSHLELGYGVASPLQKIRLYDERNSINDVRVTLYRDSASWCPYCQKVWMALEEKQIPYNIEKINMRCYGDKPASFQAMQPSGQIPVAIIDGKVYRQSNDILSALEEQTFAQYKSLRVPVGQEMLAQTLLHLERQLFSAWMDWLTSRDDGGGRKRRNFVDTLQMVETALRSSSSGGPFFLGPTVTLVDLQFAPFLERMAASMLYYKGLFIRVAPGTTTESEFPAINRWFDGMEELPSYQLTKSDYYTHCWDLPPQLGGCVSEPAGAVYRQAINGERRLLDDDGTKGSWELPLQPHNGGVEPDWTWATDGDDRTAQREAVERVSSNWQAIVSFAARGAGQPGVPSVSAPLADPHAIPSVTVQNAISSVLRIVCAALLSGSTSSHETTMSAMGQVMVQKGGSDFATGVVNSLAYVRDRIGVPRDMKLPAARQLRAHLNWTIGVILKAQES